MVFETCLFSVTCTVITKRLTSSFKLCTYTQYTYILVSNYTYKTATVLLLFLRKQQLTVLRSRRLANIILFLF